MSERKVSIIIPCFNAERFVGDAIRSALAQTYPSKEIIVIDDGSTDGSLKIIQSFGNAVRWESTKNRGGSAARNRGLQLASGSLIQFLDADDRLLPTKLEKQVEPLAQSSAAMTFTPPLPLGDEKPVIQFKPYPGGDLVIYLLRGGGPGTSGVLHRRECLEAVGGFREDLPCAQEFDLHLRLACQNFRFLYMEEPLWEYRRVLDSVSSDYSRVLVQIARVLWPAYEDLEKKGRLSEDRKREFARTMARSGRHLLRLGRTAEGVDYLRQARAMHPDGGRDVYARLTRTLLFFCGPVMTEKLVTWKRGAHQLIP